MHGPHPAHRRLLTAGPSLIGVLAHAPCSLAAAPVTQADIDEFTALLTACLQCAVDRGLQPAINVRCGACEGGPKATLALNILS